MKYCNIYRGKFIKRINRFTAVVEVFNSYETVHVKNTGRLKEILINGASVLLEKSDNANRKTQYDLVAAYKNDTLINIDSQAPNKVFYEYIYNFMPDAIYVKPECKYANSRFDFYVETNERKAFIEVKGVTLEKNGNVYFPDAPTERGIKHIKELIKAKKEGFDAYIVFIAQLNAVKSFMPNNETHKAFGEALIEAYKNGVEIKAYDCNVYENGFSINKEIIVDIGE